MFEKDVPLKTMTTLKVGGPAEFFAVVTNEQELLEIIKEAKAEQMPFRIIGGGSNVLIPDAGLPGLTIKNAISGWSEHIEGSSVIVTIGSGEVLDRAIAHTVAKEYWGLENLSHIPGTVGATPIQNVGAYGTEMSELIREVRVINTETLQVETLTNEQCSFGYRDSIFKREHGKKYIITSVTCALSALAKPNISYADLAARFAEESAPKISDIRNAIIEIRANKFPDWTQVGTAGSFFKNPIVRRVTYEKLRGEYPGLPGYDVSDIEVKIPLGWILDTVCGLKGVQKGNVGTYENQALVLVQNGAATATEIKAFADYVVEMIFQKTGLKIEWEVTQLR